MEVQRLSDDRLVEEYLRFRPGLFKRSKDSTVRKAIKLLLEVSGMESLSDFIQKFRDGDNGLHKVIQLYVNQLLQEGKKPKTVWYYITLIRDLLEFNDVECSRAFKKVKKPKKTSVRLDRIPDALMLQKMIYSSKSKRFKMLVQILAQSGLRIGEALKLKLEYIDLDNGWINVPGHITKTGKPRKVPIVRELKESLTQYVKENNLKAGSYLFSSESDPSRPWSSDGFHERWRETIKRLGLDQRDEVGYMLHPHCLRKFFKTRLEMANVNRLLIEQWMGHEIGVQGAYFMPSPQDVKKELEKAEQALAIFAPAADVEMLNKLKEYERKYLELVEKRLDEYEKLYSKLREVDEHITAIKKLIGIDGRSLNI